MQGGGALNLAPGQFTDDSELAIHLMRGLNGHDPRGGFPSEAVAREYIAWHRSSPFDMGMTCARAFGFAKDADQMRSNASRYSAASEANGALMRVAPLAMWARGMSAGTIMDLARQDARLSHPHPACQDANALFCLAIATLINHAHVGVVQAVEAALQATDEASSGVCLKVRGWYLDSRTLTLDDIVVTENIGHVKHAFTLAFRFLRMGSTFETAIRQTLMKMGDTDTNGAIVGAMMGALNGSDGIPAFMWDTPVRPHTVLLWP